MLTCIKLLEQYNEERALGNGTRLIGRFSDQSNDTWLHAVFSPIGEHELSEIQNEIGMVFPNAYKDFLKCNNGLRIFGNTLSFYGYRSNYNRDAESALGQPFDILTPNIKERLFDSEASFLYVASYSYDGSLLYIDINTQKVYRCSANSSQPINEWTSFELMLESEFKRIFELFDNVGNRLVQKTTP